MARAWVLLVLVAAAEAGPLAEVERAERAYWADFAKRFRDAGKAWYEPVRVQTHTGDTEPARDLGPFRELRAELLAIEAERAGAYRVSKDLAFLAGELEDTLDAITKAEAALARVKKRVSLLLLDPEPGFRRDALAGRLRALSDAIAKLPGAAEHLRDEVLPRARKRDGRRGFPWRQVGVLDVLGRIEPRALVPYLSSKSVPLRIVAVEALGADAMPAQDDLEPAVRRALARTLGRGAKKREDAPSFYGIPIASGRVMFLFEGSFSFTVPADHQLQRTRHVMDWGNWGSSDWKKEHESHQQVVADQLDRCLGACAPGGRFRVAMMGHPSNVVDRVAHLSGRRNALLALSARAKAVKFVEGHKVAFVHDIHLGLMRALEWPGHDTVVVVGNGEIVGGKFALPEMLLADFARRNRFRGLVVHCVRICGRGPDAEKLMRGLAESTGGRYVWSREPPR